MNEQEIARQVRGKRIGFAVTGSFCTFERAFVQASRLTNLGVLVQAHHVGARLRMGYALYDGGGGAQAAERGLQRAAHLAYGNAG